MTAALTGGMVSMKVWRRTSLVSLIVPFALWFATVPEAVADSDMDAKVRSLVAAYLAPAATGSAGGLAVAVYVDGHVQFFDYGNGNGRQPITPDTLFNLASLRKIFEATLVALGTIRGELNLDDPVAK